MIQKNRRKSEKSETERSGDSDDISGSSRQPTMASSQLALNASQILNLWNASQFWILNNDVMLHSHTFDSMKLILVRLITVKQIHVQLYWWCHQKTASHAYWRKKYASNSKMWYNTSNWSFWYDMTSQFASVDL